MRNFYTSKPSPNAKESLMNSLKKVNVRAVIFIVGGEEKRQYAEANPLIEQLSFLLLKTCPIYWKPL